MPGAGSLSRLGRGEGWARCRVQRRFGSRGNLILEIASYPPLHKTQGRGTPPFGCANKKSKPGPPVRGIREVAHSRAARTRAGKIDGTNSVNKIGESAGGFHRCLTLSFLPSVQGPG